MDRFAEELVTQGRLKQIEKETRSIGALLDKRHMYDIEEPGRFKLRESSLARKEAAVRTSSRRNARTSTEIKDSTDAALAALRKKGITLATLVSQGFENEELIWKTKASDPQYIVKRKFNHPELQAFRESFNIEQKKIFKEKCLESLTNLAQKYRDEIWEVKDQMDSAGIFHPDANTHRAHCMYLMKLYKGITSENIEDPILRNMMNEINAKARQAELEQRRNERLLKLAAGELLPPDDQLLENSTDKIEKKSNKTTNRTMSTKSIGKADTMRGSKSAPNIGMTSATMKDNKAPKIKTMDKEKSNTNIRDNNSNNGINGNTTTNSSSNEKTEKIDVHHARLVILNHYHHHHHHHYYYYCYYYYCYYYL